MLPVTLVTVVLARVDEPVAKIFCVLVVEALVVVEFRVVIVPVVAKRFVNIPDVMFASVAKKFVEVEFVIVPFPTSIAGRDKLLIERLVIVAFVIVALVPFAFAKFVVEAFVVEALSVVIFPLVAKRFVKIPETAVNVFAKRFERTFKLLIEEVAATSWFPAIFVAVRFVAVVEPRVVEPFV